MDDSFLLLAVISTTIFLLLAVFIVSFALLFRRRQQQNIREKLELKVAFEEEILKSQVEVQNQTLIYIGQELHDNIGQLLAVAKLYLGSLEELAPQGEAYDLTLNTSSIIDKITDDVRALTKSLDGSFVEEFGLINTLTQEISRIQKTRRIAIELITTGSIYSLGPKKEIIIYRIIQEVLTNVFKHSGAKNVIIKINYYISKFELSIIDDGTGFDYNIAINSDLIKSGAGIRNIERRAELAGGVCIFQTSPGKGTTIIISLAT